MNKMKCAALTITIALAQGANAERFYDGFENGGNSSDFFQWEGGAYSTISSGFSYEGDRALQFGFEGNPDLDEDSWAEKRFRLGDVYSELWIRYKLWVPENYFHRDGNGPDNNKGLIMLWSGSYSGSGSGASTSLHFGRPPGLGSLEQAAQEGDSMIYGAWRPNVGITYNFYNDDDYRDDSASADEAELGIVKSDLGTWIDWVIHVKASDIPIEPHDLDGAGNGKVQVWKNGRLTYNADKATNYFPASGENGWDQGYLLGWANSGFDEETVMYIDEFIIGTTAEDIGFELMKPSFGSVIKQVD